VYAVDGIILIGGILLFVAILSSKVSVRIGAPALVVFMAIGMLAGEDGPGGLQFDQYPLAHAIGTLALVLILFDGGLQTPWRSFRLAWKPAVALSTLGVVVTSGITGLAAAWVLDVPLLVGLLLGSIVGSTDAAAVFAALRGRSLHIRERLASTLEIESGSNDPMAVLLTLGLVSVLTGAMEPGWALGQFFLQQAVVGALGGVAVGWFGIRLLNRVELSAAGLYPVLTMALCLLAYGVPAYLGGSGFLSVYLAGLVLGNANIVFKHGVSMAHDGGAWMAQIVMFIMLGLLATPSGLPAVAMEGVAVAMVLVFVARPVAVTLSLIPFGYTWRELVFLSWAGLKGAIPIILAIYPLLLGVEQGALLFNVVFFVVLLSTLTQGWSLPAMARWLGVREAGRPDAPVTLEISSLKHVDGDIVQYAVDDESWIAGHLVRDLALPETAVIAMIARGQEVIPPRGTTKIEAGDHVFVVMKPQGRSLVDRLFGRKVARGPVLKALELPMSPETRVDELEAFYGVHLDPRPDRTVASLLVERLGDDLAEGSEIQAGEVMLSVRKLEGGVIREVGVEIFIEAEDGGGDASS
jgi:potassium/hydrogen antiporter